MVILSVKRIARCVFGAQKPPLRGHLRWSGQGFAPGDDEPFLHPKRRKRRGHATAPLGPPALGREDGGERSGSG